MFDTRFRAKIKLVTLFAKTLDHKVFRRVRLTLERDFDSAAVDGLGKPAAHALEHLRDRGFAKVEIPIDAVQADAELDAGANEQITIRSLVGMKAIAMAPKPRKTKDGDENTDEPLVKLIFVMQFKEEDVLFLSRHYTDFVDVTLKRAQLSLPLPGSTTKAGPTNGHGGAKATSGDAAALSNSLKEISAPPANGKRGKGRRAGAGGAAGQSVADPQQASSPEEAERIREQRLREEKMLEERAWADEPPPSDDDSDDDEDAHQAGPGESVAVEPMAF